MNILVTDDFKIFSSAYKMLRIFFRQKICPYNTIKHSINNQQQQISRTCIHHIECPTQNTSHLQNNPHQFQSSLIALINKIKTNTNLNLGKYQHDENIQVLSQLKNLNLRTQERQKINTSNGCWYCKKDAKGMLYFVLCSPNYPERHIMSAINQVKEHLQKLPEYESQPDSSLKVHANGFIQQICQKYQNLQSTDKVSVIRGHLDQIRTSVSDSTRKMMQNQVQLEQLQKKSQTLKDHAHQFSQSATELERIMYWRNCKIKILIGLVIACLIAFIIVPIVAKGQSSA